jgi:peptide deformylase
MYQAARTTGVGIAAPQVGINRKVICLQRWDKTVGSGIFVSHPWEFYFNPQIVEYSDSVVRRSDGCLSVPDGSNYPTIGGFSYRATWVIVTYYDVDGIFHEEKINHQYTAHIFQHEIDHLNAVMFFDRQVEENAYKYTIIEGDSYEGLPEIR